MLKVKAKKYIWQIVTERKLGGMLVGFMTIQKPKILFIKRL